MLSRDNSGSSNSSFPNSSWVDWGINWKGSSRTVGSFDPSAPLLPDLPALEVLSEATGVWLGASGHGSLDFSVVSALGKLAAGVSINLITGDSRADRLVPSEPLDIQLRKSWTWSFSCVERYWILAKQYSEKESWGKQDKINRILYTYWPASRRGTFLCHKDPGVAFCFLLSSESASAEVGGIQYQDL